MAGPDAHDHEGTSEHSHGTLRFLHADANDETTAYLRPLHPALADNLLYSRRFAKLNDAEKASLLESQRAVETYGAWSVGYHASGDICATCGTPTSAIFTDVFESGTLPYGAFIDEVPVHARKECIEGFAQKLPRRSPQALDKLRRESTRDRDRPGARMVQFFRHDVLAQPPFELEDWANSVAEANGGRLPKAQMRDVERLLHWVHHRLFH